MSNNTVEVVPPTFREELEALVNKHSMENGSDTPDYILAEFMAGCLATFDQATKERDRWYGRTNKFYKGEVDGV